MHAVARLVLVHVHEIVWRLQMLMLWLCRFHPTLPVSLWCSQQNVYTRLPRMYNAMHIRLHERNTSFHETFSLNCKTTFVNMPYIHIRQWHVMAFSGTRWQAMAGPDSMHLHLWDAENSNIIKKTKWKKAKTIGNGKWWLVCRGPPRISCFLHTNHTEPLRTESNYWLKNAFILNIWLDTSFRHGSLSLQRKWLRNGRVQTIVEGQSQSLSLEPHSICVHGIDSFSRSEKLHYHNHVINYICRRRCHWPRQNGDEKKSGRRKQANPITHWEFNLSLRCTVYVLV